MVDNTEVSPLLENSSQNSLEQRNVYDSIADRSEVEGNDVDEGHENRAVDSLTAYADDGRFIDEEASGFDDVQSKYDEDEVGDMRRIKDFAKRRLWWFFGLGMLAIVAMHLSFLPRTSVSRDFKRWHGLHFTQADLSRNFLLLSRINGSHGGVQNEQYIDWWLSNLTDINSRHPFSMSAEDNPELSTYVKDKFKEFGCITETVSYDFEGLDRPVSSSLKLVDSENNVKYDCPMYEGNFKTPAYYSFGAEGEVKSEYVFVNGGSDEDYSLLKSNKIDVRNKIVIVKATPEDNFNIHDILVRSENQGAVGVVTYGKHETTDSGLLEKSILRDGLATIPYSETRIPKIPAIPVSYDGIKFILRHLKHSETDSPFSKWDHYPTSSDSTKLHMTTTSVSKNNRKVSNIIGTLEGTLKDGVVVIGSKRDSLTSQNPLSGHAVMFEIMRNFNQLRALGWKPMRTIQFVSWDASASGQLGLQLMIDDEKSFKSKRSIISYINIDSDAVEGNDFSIDSHPMLNDLLITTSQYIPFPEKKRKSLASDSTVTEQKIEADSYSKEVSDLYLHWFKQNNATINNDFDQSVSRSEITVFESHCQIPAVNVKFKNDRTGAEYLPNSNSYSYNWLKNEHVDDEFILHGSLIRYIGLLALSVGEREVVHYKTHPFYTYMKNELDNILSTHPNLELWSNRTISIKLLNDWSLLSDIQDHLGKVSHMTLSNVLEMIDYVSDLLTKNSLVFDNYNSRVKDSLSEDYPWYKFYKKLHIYAKFKVSNFKLLHLERDLKLVDKDYDYLELPAPLYFDHIMYTSNAAYDAGTFKHLRDAIENDDLELTIKWLVLIYDKLRKIGKSIA